MQFTYWTSFKKKKGSTAKPSGGTNIAVVLKEDTSVVRPTIKLAGFGYNSICYGYISDFGRYYFIRDIRKVGPNTEIDLVSDPMASFKSDILANFQYVERASSGPLLVVPDPLNPPTEEEYSINTQVASLASLMSISSGIIMEYYILTVASTQGIKTYGLDYAGMVNFYNYVFADRFSILQNLSNDFYHVSDCLVSLKKSPFIPVGNPNQPIYLRDVDSGVTGIELNMAPLSVITAANVALEFPSNSIGGLTGVNYLDFAPYSSGALFLPFVGVVPLDMDIFGADREIGIECYIDQRTVDIVYKVKTLNDKVVATYAGNAGADVPLAAQSGNMLGAVGGVMQTIGGIGALKAGDPVGISHVAGGIASTINSIERHTQINGNLSSMVGAYLGQAIKAEIRTRKPLTWDLEEMRDTNGVIIDKSQGLNDLTGFCKCIDAKCETSATDDERAEIENYMNTGFFIE